MGTKNYTALQGVVIGGESYRLGATVTLDPESRQAKQLIQGGIIGERGAINANRPPVAPGELQSSSLVGQASPETTANESGNGETTTTTEPPETDQAQEQSKTPEPTEAQEQPELNGAPEATEQPETETRKRGRKKQA